MKELQKQFIKNFNYIFAISKVSLVLNSIGVPTAMAFNKTLTKSQIIENLEHYLVKILIPVNLVQE